MSLLTCPTEKAKAFYGGPSLDSLLSSPNFHSAVHTAVKSWSWDMGLHADHVVYTPNSEGL